MTLLRVLSLSIPNSSMRCFIIVTDGVFDQVELDVGSFDRIERGLSMSLSDCMKDAVEWRSYPDDRTMVAVYFDHANEGVSDTEKKKEESEKRACEKTDEKADEKTEEKTEEKTDQKTDEKLLEGLAKTEKEREGEMEERGAIAIEETESVAEMEAA